ncbi:hypothetical protein [Halomonas colorata]|uniref:Uncharacterized protein n=1 Tax=Halomonas colorata TaxID=2742615 RepID=A0ABR9G2Y0_9GAMM|nr:hypothetical protein [Halomonas colorata]MBE0465273.1 hypothetical protein [Halomonas colorata]
MYHKQQTLAAPSCITFDVLQDQADPCRYNVSRSSLIALLLTSISGASRIPIEGN